MQYAIAVCYGNRMMQGMKINKLSLKIEIKII